MTGRDAGGGSGDGEHANGSGAPDPRSSIWWAVRDLRWWEKAYLLVAALGLGVYLLLRWTPVVAGP